MKRLTAPGAASRGAAARITAGSRTVADGLQAGVEAWVRAARRDDLTGWRASLGPLVRLGILAAAEYVLVRILDAVPWLMWALTAGWCWKAWHAASTRAEPEAVPDAPPAAAGPGAEAVQAAVLDWVRQAIGDRQGVHLRDLLANAQQHGMHTGLDLSEFRGQLEAAGVPVRKRVRVRGLGVTVGIHRDDLPAPAGPSPAAPSQESPGSQLHAA